MIIRPASPGDLAAMASIHVRAFDGFFLARLGSSFLREYYRVVWRYHGGIALVCCSSASASLEGFVAGFVDPSAFYRVLRSHRLRLAFTALPGLLRRPALLPRLLGNARKVHESRRHAASARVSELASIAVLPPAQGKGLGKLLTQAFLSQSRLLGADCVSLVTDADANENVNRFYQMLGFRISEVFESHGGRRMHRYELMLGSSQGPGPICAANAPAERAGRSLSDGKAVF